MWRVVELAVAIIGLLLVTQYFLEPRAPGAGSRMPDGGTVLRMRRGRYTSLSSLALAPAAIICWVVLTLRPTPNDWAPVLLASALVTTCVSTGAWCLAAEFLARIRVDGRGIDCIGPLGHRAVAWGEISRFRYNPGNHWFFITLADGSHLWLWADLTGIGFFAELALARLPPASLWGDADARLVLEELARTVQAMT